MSREATLTFELVSSLLAYDPDTGFVLWVASKGRSKAGNRAGSVNGSGYRQVRIDGVIVNEHRVAFLLMTGRWPTLLMDHINGNRDDNRWCNLREATGVENGINKGVQRNNSSGFAGIHWHKKAQRWRVRVWTKRSDTFIGQFACFGKAVKARRNAAEARYGRFAVHNSRQLPKHLAGSDA